MNTKMEQFPATNPNPVLSVIKDGTVIYSNEAGKPLLHEWNVKVGEKLPSIISERVQSVFYLNNPDKIEFKVGKTVYLLAFHPLTEEECVNIYGFDISEQKELEEKLLESEEKYRNIVEIANEGVWVADAENKTTYVNKKMAEMLGYSPEELMGKLAMDFVDPEYKAYAELRMEKRQKGIDEVHENKLVRKDGSTLWAFINSKSLFDKDGKFTGVLAMLTDITERKKAEEALKKAHDSLEVKVKERTAELEEAQRMAHIGNWVWGIANDKAYWSEELYRIFGRNPKELAPSYNEYLNYIHPDDRDYADNAHKEALNGKAFSIDHRIILANGEVRTVHIKTEVIFDDENVTIRLKGTVQDITERKRIEEQLRESEEKYRNIVETANEGIIIIDDEAIITYVNKKMVDMLGYTQEEDIRRPIWDFISEEHKLIVKRNLEKRRQGISESYELKLIRKDGSPLWTLINARALFYKNGKFMGSLCMITDITEHKKLMDQTRQRAEEMTKIMDVAPVAMLIGHDPHSQRITGNRTANLLFETEVGENVSANVTPVRRFFSKGHELTADELPMQQAALKNIDVHNVEFDVLLSSEKRLSLLGSASPLHDANGHVRGSVGAFMDITERREAEEALKNIEIARKKEIHHRIKNNLQVISSLLDLQAEQFSNRGCINDSEVLRAFRESQDRVTSMALIHEELYRGEETNRLDFSSYIKELADNLFLTYRVGNKDISLNIDLEEKAFFDIDTAIPLGIIINELVSNSFKYAFQGRDKGEIRIRLRREEFNNTSFILTISDNGVGIPEDLDIENLDSLGMQLVTTLVNQLDGELELNRNNGTEFTIRFTV